MEKETKYLVYPKTNMVLLVINAILYITHLFEMIKGDDLTMLLTLALGASAVLLFPFCHFIAEIPLGRYPTRKVHPSFIHLIIFLALSLALLIWKIITF